MEVMEMADTLQKVFLLFVRPYYNEVVSGNTYKVPYIGAITSTNDKQLITNNADVSLPSYSPSKINFAGKYKADPWFLHSSYTSYEDMRLSLKSLITVYGTDNIKCTVSMPIDYDILPNE
jgi:hypothetical protein